MTDAVVPVKPLMLPRVNPAATAAALASKVQVQVQLKANAEVLARRAFCEYMRHRDHPRNRPELYVDAWARLPERDRHCWASIVYALGFDVSQAREEMTVAHNAELERLRGMLQVQRDETKRMTELHRVADGQGFVRLAVIQKAFAPVEFLIEVGMLQL